MSNLNKFTIIALISLVLGSNTGYLTHLEGSEFLVTNTTTVVEYRCTYGGEPLAIWGAKIDEEIDSKSTLEPIYVKTGFIASNLEVESHIRGDNVEVGKLHFKVKNPANGGLSFSLSRNETFFVDTVLFSTKLSEFSNKIVTNFQIFTDDNQFGGAIPHREFDFAASTGLFVYENTKKVTSFNFSWDQLTQWSDYFVQGEQDIYVKVSPRKYEEDHYEGNGFWICGQDKESTVLTESKKTLKNKYFYEEYDESVQIDKKTKKSKKIFDESFKKGLATKGEMSFLQ